MTDDADERPRPAFAYLALLYGVAFFLAAETGNNVIVWLLVSGVLSVVVLAVLWAFFAPAE